MTTAAAVASGAIVLDTNVVSELMRAVPDLRMRKWVDHLAPACVYTSAVTLAEVRLGIARLPMGRRRSLLTDAADDVFHDFADHILPFDATAADRYGDIVVEREQAGTPISGFDAQVAAICRSHGATLATRNTGDFAHLELDLVDPWLTGT